MLASNWGKNIPMRGQRSPGLCLKRKEEAKLVSEELTSQCYSHHRFSTSCLRALSSGEFHKILGKHRRKETMWISRQGLWPVPLPSDIKNWLHVAAGVPMSSILGSLLTRIKLKDDTAVDNRSSLFPSLLEPIKFRCSKARVSFKSHQHLNKQNAFSHS